MSGVKGQRSGGHNKKVATAAQLELIVAEASKGRSEASIARKLGLSKPTWFAWKGRDRRVVDALWYGQGQREDELRDDLRRAQKKGNVIAVLAELNSDHGWRGDREDTGPPRVTIVMPGAMQAPQPSLRLDAPTSVGRDRARPMRSTIPTFCPVLSYSFRGGPK